MEKLSDEQRAAIKVAAQRARRAMKEVEDALEELLVLIVQQTVK